MNSVLPLSSSEKVAPSGLLHPAPTPRPMFSPAPRPVFPPVTRVAVSPAAPTVPRSMAERMNLAKERIRAAAEAGQRIRSYEVALDLDLSEFHFARQFRAAFQRSPHVYYDEIRAERARSLLREGCSEGEVARRIGFRRPAELRALLQKRREPASV